jgi:hypothetical protein
MLEKEFTRSDLGDVTVTPTLVLCHTYCPLVSASMEDWNYLLEILGRDVAAVETRLSAFALGLSVPALGGQTLLPISEFSRHYRWRF